uniref:ML domain-containing protein n=1 Tax=Elaeophora elaphi TaxID=1147741 RepID=A0A0R3RJV2_9BILA
MSFLVALSVAVNVSLYAKTCKALNGSEFNFTWIPCSGGPIIYHSTKLMDENHREIYPIVAAKSFIRLTNITNTGEHDNLVQCNKTIECPIKHGKKESPVTFDLSQIRFFTKTHPNNKRYRIQLGLLIRKRTYIHVLIFGL